MRPVEILILRTQGIVPWIIHFGMRIFLRKNDLQSDWIPNHAEVKVGNTVSGAVAKGVKSRSYDSAYKKWHKPEIKAFPITLDEEQYRKGIEYLILAENTPYEFENFWYHARKVLWGGWKGSTTARELYCIEHAIRFLNATGVYGFINPYLNPVEFYLELKRLNDEYTK